jgi:hypothetical protein
VSKHASEWLFLLLFNAFSLSFNIIISIMTREIEIEISDQSDAISLNILKRKKRDVEKLIAELSSLSSNYISISMSSRSFVSHERLQIKSQTSFSLFTLFFCSTLLEIMIKHINIKTQLKKVEVTSHSRLWHDITSTEIEAFIEILLYIRLNFMLRISNYWNFDSKHSIHVLIINCMSCYRWKQIKRFLKIFNLVENEKIDTRDFHWWKKLESLITDFRIVSKKYWTSDNHLSIDEQLIDFRERFVHTMMLICKIAKVNFKLYSLCQKNYLIDFLFTSKIWSQNMKNRVWKADILTQKVKISELKTTNQLDVSIIKWKFTSSFLMIIQLCKNLSSDLDFVLFTNNFFINARLFKVLRMRNIEICDTIKIDSDYLIELMRIRAAVIKQKDWDKMSLMTVKSDKKMNIDDEDVLCMTWMNNNIVQYMIIIHIVDEMKKMIYRDAKCRNEVFKSVICDEKLSFSTSIVEYNQHMSESNENAQQRAYYSSSSSFRRSDDRSDSPCSCVVRYVSCFARPRRRLRCSFSSSLMILKKIFVINVMSFNIEIFVINVTYVSKKTFVINAIFVVKITFVINVIFYEFVHLRNIVLLVWCLIVSIYVL